MSFDTPCRITTVLGDSAGNSMGFPLYGKVDSSLTIAQLLTDVSNTLYYLSFNVAGKAIYSRIALEVSLPAEIVGTPAAGTDVQFVGLYRFAGGVGDRKPLAVWLPAINRTRFPDGVLNMTDFRNTDFGYMIRDGWTALAFSDPYGNDYGTLQGGKQTFHRLRGIG